MYYFIKCTKASFTKHSVPDDEHATIVLVNTVPVSAMVYPVMTGSVQKVLQWTKFVHHL